MKNIDKPIEPIPESFASYEEAAEFWETRDTTDYVTDFETISGDIKFHKRHFEVELDEDIVEWLHQQTEGVDLTVNHLVNELLRQQMELMS